MIQQLRSFIILCFLALFMTSISAQEKAQEYKLLTDISYTDVYKTEITAYMAERCKLDIYYPENKKDFATVVWFHGGGLFEGNKNIADKLKNQGLAIVAVNYRLYPKVKSPACIEDAAAAVAWVFRNIEKYGGDAAKIFVAGHSAGGYLTYMIGLDKSYLASYSIDANDISGLISFSGQAITHLKIREDMGIKGKQPLIDKYAPLFHVRADAPPLVIISGDRELELLGRYEENAYLYRMMKVAGHEHTSLFELDGFNHSDMCNPAYHILVNQVDKILKEKK